MLYALNKTYWALPGSAEQFRRAHLARSCDALQAIGQTGSLNGTADKVQKRAIAISTITLHIKQGRRMRYATTCDSAKATEADKPWCEAHNAHVLILPLVIASDEMCMAHRRSMYGSEAAANITFGAMTSFFAGAASVVNPEQLRSVWQHWRCFRILSAR